MMPITDEEVLAYRQWILSYEIDGCTIEEGRGDGLVIRSDSTNGVVNFYDIDGMTIVELRLEKAKDQSPLFFLHFEFVHEARARELFEEMAMTLRERTNREIQHVLLCCTVGMTTTYFANKLNELASEQDLPYDFCAKSVVDAKSSGMSFVAVLLAPQVGHQLKDVRAALPDTMVLEIPASIFGAYNADGAMRLLTDALSSARRIAKSDLRFARDFDKTKSVLAMSYVMRPNEHTLSIVAIDHGEERLRVMLVRNEIEPLNAIRDMDATLRMHGYKPQDFDAVGIAVPTIVDRGSIEVLSDDGERGMVDVATLLSEEWGVPVFVDNTATAAAAGCYVSQTEWDNIVFHSQPIGIVDCDQGYVIDGKPHAGRGGYDGNLGLMAKRFALSMDLEDAAWRYNGVRELVSCYLSAAICSIAPDALFVWCDFLPDMDELREELEKTLPAEAIPELVEVSDHDGLTLMGELSLCFQRLVE